MTEISYIAARQGLSMTKPAEGGASPAYEAFLKLAGCWQEKPEKANIHHPTVLADGHHGEHSASDKLDQSPHPDPLPVERGEGEAGGGSLENPVLPKDVTLPA